MAEEDVPPPAGPARIVSVTEPLSPRRMETEEGEIRDDDEEEEERGTTGGGRGGEAESSLKRGRSDAHDPTPLAAKRPKSSQQHHSSSQADGQQSGPQQQPHLPAPVAASSSSAAAAAAAVSSSSSSSNLPRKKRGRGFPVGKLLKWNPRRTEDLYVRTSGKNGHVGEGTYGSVFVATTRDEHQRKVALKEIKMAKETEGFPITAIREIKALQKMSRYKTPNVVRLEDVLADEKGNVSLVLEFCDHDLAGLLKEKRASFSSAQIKYYMKCVLEGLYACHEKGIIHRDIKSANILISNNGDVKLADFGLARSMPENDGNLTRRVVTLWYRAPELLHNCEKYDQKIDMWAAGCLFGELLQGGPLFKGDSEMTQIEKIYKLCGSPTTDDWPEHKDLFKLKKTYPRRLRDQFKEHPADAVDLLDKLLQLNPAKRYTAKDALMHPYFYNNPLPMTAEEHPKYTKNFHEMQGRRPNNKSKPSLIPPASMGVAASSSAAAGQARLATTGGASPPPLMASAMPAAAGPPLAASTAAAATAAAAASGGGHHRDHHHPRRSRERSRERHHRDRDHHRHHHHRGRDRDREKERRYHHKR